MRAGRTDEPASVLMARRREHLRQLEERPPWMHVAGRVLDDLQVSIAQPQEELDPPPAIRGVLGIDAALGKRVLLNELLGRETEWRPPQVDGLCKQGHVVL